MNYDNFRRDDIPKNVDIVDARERAAKLDPTDSRRVWAITLLDEAEDLLASEDTSSRDVQFQVARLVHYAETTLASPPGILD